MSTSRYINTKNDNYDYHNTFKQVTIASIVASDDFFYVLKDRERLDQIARRFLGDGRYWWIICLMNDFSGPFDKNIRPGIVIRITRNVNNIISKL